MQQCLREKAIERGSFSIFFHVVHGMCRPGLREGEKQRQRGEDKERGRDRQRDRSLEKGEKYMM